MRQTLVATLQWCYKSKRLGTSQPMIDNEEELVFFSMHRSATILDSGTTSCLIKDRGCFIDIEDEDHPLVKTTSQGNLSTTGRGMCIVKIELGESIY